MRMPALLLLVPFTLGLAACTSPEASRTQGGGPGGDTGNRPAIVRMHEGSRPYHEIRRLVPVDAPSLDTASHATAYGQR